MAFNFLIIKLDSTSSHKGSIRQNWAAIVPTRMFTASFQENKVPFWIKTLIYPSFTWWDCQHSEGRGLRKGEELMNIHFEYMNEDSGIRIIVRLIPSLLLWIYYICFQVVSTFCRYCDFKSLIKKTKDEISSLYTCLKSKHVFSVQLHEFYLNILEYFHSIPTFACI